MPEHFPCGIARPFPIPVVRVFSRSSTESSTALGSWISPFFASKATNSPMASFLVLARIGTRMFWALRISVKRMSQLPY